MKRPEDIPVTRELEELASIEDVRSGDYVLTRDDSTQRSSYRKVTELVLHKVKLLYRIALSDGSVLNPPFYVMGTGVGDQNCGMREYMQCRFSEFLPRVQTIGNPPGDGQRQRTSGRDTL